MEIQLNGAVQNTKYRAVQIYAGFHNHMSSEIGQIFWYIMELNELLSQRNLWRAQEHRCLSFASSIYSRRERLAVSECVWVTAIRLR